LDMQLLLKKCQIGLEKISGIAFSAIKKDSQNLVGHFKSLRRKTVHCTVHTLKSQWEKRNRKGEGEVINAVFKVAHFSHWSHILLFFCLKLTGNGFIQNTRSRPNTVTGRAFN
jgi:hypothetical protein